MSKNILIVAAHPDDEVLGCGGTIARHVSEGDKVNIVYMADGITSRDLQTHKDSEVRQTASHKAQEILGIQHAFYLEFADNKMDSYPLLDIVQALEKVILQYQPSIIYTHHLGDLNIDHQVTHKAVMTACRPQPNFCVKKIYSFEVVSSTEWNSPNLHPFIPNFFVDISQFLDTKLLALDAYQLEMREPPHSRSKEHIKSLTQHRGHSMGLDAAEAFMLLRHIH